MDRQTGSPGRSVRCFDGNCGVIVKDSMYNGCGDGDINLEDNVYLEMILILDMLMKMMFIKKMVLKMVMVMKTHLLQTVQQTPDQSHA